MVSGLPSEVRKLFMARPLRIEHEGDFYHVMARGNEQGEDLSAILGLSKYIIDIDKFGREQAVKKKG